MPKIFTTLVFRDVLFRTLFILSVVLNLAMWGVLYWKFSPLQALGDRLPLHYNVYFGIDFVGPWYKVFIMPLAGIFFVVVNFVLADAIYLRDKVTSYFLVGSATFAQALIFLAAYAVIMLNQ